MRLVGPQPPHTSGRAFASQPALGAKGKSTGSLRSLVCLGSCLRWAGPIGTMALSVDGDRAEIGDDEVGAGGAQALGVAGSVDRED